MNNDMMNTLAAVRHAMLIMLYVPTFGPTSVSIAPESMSAAESIE